MQNCSFDIEMIQLELVHAGARSPHLQRASRAGTEAHRMGSRGPWNKLRLVPCGTLLQADAL